MPVYNFSSVAIPNSIIIIMLNLIWRLTLCVVISFSSGLTYLFITHGYLTATKNINPLKMLFSSYLLQLPSYKIRYRPAPGANYALNTFLLLDFSKRTNNIIISWRLY